jgi:DNA-binding MarR family transcriptional regulator
MANVALFETVLNSLPPDAHHRRAWLALLNCFSRIERILMQHIAQEYNSSLPRYDILTALALHKHSLTMGELATMLGVTKGNITGVVRRLSHDGLVRKVTLKEDRRIQSVSITPEGRKLWVAMHDDYDRIISRLLSGQTNDQVKSLTRALKQTLKAVDKIASGL